MEWCYVAIKANRLCVQLVLIVYTIEELKLTDREEREKGYLQAPYGRLYRYVLRFVSIDIDRYRSLSTDVGRCRSVSMSRDRHNSLGSLLGGHVVFL